MASQKVTAIRKRQKIQDSSKTMFIWVAGMSAVIGICLVLSWFLWQQIAFKNEVISKKNQTADRLVANNEAVPILRDNIRVLETNRALNSSKANNDDKALQVILDALPADANSLALGASLQESLAGDINGLSIESLTVDPAAEEMGDGGEFVSDTVAEDGSEGTSSSRIQFTMTATSRNVNSLRDLLQRFERSIRVIDIDSLTLDRSELNYTLTIQAHAYYEPARVIEMKKERVTPQ